MLYMHTGVLLRRQQNCVCEQGVGRGGVRLLPFSLLTFHENSRWKSLTQSGRFWNSPVVLSTWGIMGVTHGKKADNTHQHLSSGCAQPLIGPDLASDLGSVIDPDQRWEREEDLDQSQLLPEQTDNGYYDELIRPKKLPNPIKSSKSHRELHRELVITHKRGAVVEEKPELQRVLEQRNRAQALKQERKVEGEKSPLEQELLRRQMRLEKYEREAEEQRERSKGAPEFIRVKESLKRTAVTNTVEKEL